MLEGYFRVRYYGTPFDMCVLAKLASPIGYIIKHTIPYILLLETFLIGH